MLEQLCCWWSIKYNAFNLIIINSRITVEHKKNDSEGNIEKTGGAFTSLWLADNTMNEILPLFEVCKNNNNNK